MRQVFGRDATASVGDDDFDGVAIRGIAHLDATIEWRVLDGVIEDVDEDTSEPVRVSNDFRRRPFRQMESHRLSFSCGVILSSTNDSSRTAQEIDETLLMFQSIAWPARLVGSN